MLSFQGDSFTVAAISLKSLFPRENFLHLETSGFFFFPHKFGQGKFENSVSRDREHFMMLPKLVSSIWKMAAEASVA